MASASAAPVDVGRYMWERIPDMPTPRCYSVAAYHQGKLYIMGKEGGGSAASYT